VILNQQRKIDLLEKQLRQMSAAAGQQQFDDDEAQ
jgi:hypothetical protein